MDNIHLPQRAPLTERELEVLALIAEGLSTNSIAEQLVLSPHTVAWYTKQIFKKLDVSRRTQAVAIARNLGLLAEQRAESDSLQPGEWNRPRSNLPIQPTPFIGRQDEITRIMSMLDDKNCRLLTLVGPGGIGKTRLAVAVAATWLDRVGSQVYFIALQSLTSPDAIMPTIASSLSFQLQAGGGDLVKQLSDFFRGKSILLLMDNFEHLLDGTQLVPNLLSAASKVQILATSRESLNLREEYLYKVEGLQFPNHTEFTSTDEFSAIGLFTQRASQLQPSFSLNETLHDVIRICQLVSGMPLAIELAASWTRTLSCGQIAEEIMRGLDILVTRLRNVPERHRSMQVVFDYSWKMLSDEARATFQRLSVFRGGCTLDAAQYVADTDLHVLQTLVDKSFISFDLTSRRYNIHELLRQYGELRLKQSSNISVEIYDMHCSYYAEFLDQRREDGFGHKQGQLIHDVRADLDNIRAAWRWAVENRTLDAIQKSAQTLFVFFTLQSRFQEAADEFEVAIRRLDGKETDEQSGIVLAAILNYCAWSYVRFGDYESARAMFERSRKLYQLFNVPPLPGWTTEPLVGLSLLASVQGDYVEGEKLGKDACRISEERADRWELQTALYVTTSACFHQGKYEEARKYAEQADTISIETGDQWFRAIILNDLGRIARVQGNFAEAKKHYLTSLTIRKMFEDPQGVAAALNQLGQLAVLGNDHVEARSLYQESHDLYQDIGDQGGVGNALCGLGAIARAMGEYPLSRRYYNQALYIVNDSAYTPLIFSVFLGVSELLLDMEYYVSGVELLALILHHENSDNEAIERADQILATWRDKINIELGEETYITVWERGKHKRIEAAVQELLAEFSDTDAT